MAVMAWVNRKSWCRSVTNGAEKWLHMHHHLTAGRTPIIHWLQPPVIHQFVTYDVTADCVSALKAGNFKILCAKPADPSKDQTQSPIPLKDINFGENTAVFSTSTI
jgi:hypothetical protein